MQHLSEFKHLLDSCIAGDREAQKVLYDQLASRMFPVCIRYVGDRMLAEDVLQEGFITLFTKLKSYKGDGSFDGWARRIFVTTALMSLRKKDALKMSEDLDAVKGMKAETTTQVQNIGYKELMELVVSLPPGFRLKDIRIRRLQRRWELQKQHPGHSSAEQDCGSRTR